MKLKKLITHPGTAHADDFRAACILLHLYPGLTLERREPTEEELKDPEVLIFDVGKQHRPELNNYDHHQFVREAEPTCALALLNEQFEWGLEEYGWYEFMSILDSKGPRTAAGYIGTDTEGLMRTLSPEQTILIKRFGEAAYLKVSDNSEAPMASVNLGRLMGILGSDLLSYPKKIKREVEELLAKTEVLEVKEGVKALKFPTEETYEPASMQKAKAFFEETSNVVFGASVSKHPRGGLALYRYDDDERWDYSQLEGHKDIEFAHKMGFVAVTKSEEAEVLPLLQKAIK